MSKKTEKSLLSPKFALALQFANEIHSTQTRKGLGAPYISHLMAVSGLVLEYGGNETQAIAALLHDAAEDCGGRPMLETVRVLFGNDVAQIVEDCTDTFDDSKPDWLAVSAWWQHSGVSKKRTSVSWLHCVNQQDL